MALSRRDVFPSKPSKAGRRGPFRAPDTDPSPGKGARGTCSSGPMPLLSSACLWKYPLYTTLKKMGGGTHQTGPIILNIGFRRTHRPRINEQC